jgi:hypothetical protein
VDSPLLESLGSPLFKDYRYGNEAEQFISQYGDQLALTKEVVTMVGYDRGLVTLLLDRSRSPITKQAMNVIFEEFSRNGEVMKMLLDRHGDQIPMTGEFVKTVAKKCDGQTMKLLLDKRGNDIALTREVLEAAAENNSSKEEVVMELLKRYQNQVSINTDVAKFIAGHFDGQVMRLFLDLCGEQAPIDEEVMKAAAESRYGEEVLTVILNQQEQTPITEGVVAAAVENKAIGNRLLLFLLDKHGGRTPVTKEVVKAAAGNENHGVELITLLLDKRGD